MVKEVLFCMILISMHWSCYRVSATDQRKCLPRHSSD